MLKGEDKKSTGIVIDKLHKDFFSINNINASAFIRELINRDESFQKWRATYGQH